MSGWKKIPLTPEMVRAGVMSQIQDLCVKPFMAAMAPAEAAMFARQSIRDGDVHDELFFSPAMARLVAPVLAIYGAVDCQPPPREKTSLLIGNGDPRTSLLKAEKE